MFEPAPPFVHNPKIHKPNELSAYSFGEEAAVERLDWIIERLHKGIIVTTWNAAIDAAIDALTGNSADRGLKAIQLLRK